MMLIFGGFRREDKLRMTSDKFYVFDVGTFLPFTCHLTYT